MEDFIPISTLNDFIFCPYSIYLHNVYMEVDEGLYHATPQTQGKVSHDTIDKKTSSTKKNDILSLSIYSYSLGIMGKIDLYRKDARMLIERKYRLKNIYKGQIYQLWAQFYCLKEMNYKIEHLAFYEISTNKMISIELPGEKEYLELKTFIDEFKRFNPDDKFNVNINKCIHCIYCNICDKSELDNVYT